MPRTAQHRRKPAYERLIAHSVDGDDPGIGKGPCRIWTRCKTADGYGRITADGRVQNAHRLSYKLFVGDFPDHLIVDHLCRNPSCIQPAHLEPVTHDENIRRGDLRRNGRQNAQKSHCPSGHPYSGANLYTGPNGHRRCRACMYSKRKERYALDPEWRAKVLTYNNRRYAEDENWREYRKAKERDRYKR